MPPLFVPSESEFFPGPIKIQRIRLRHRAAFYGTSTPDISEHLWNASVIVICANCMLMIPEGVRAEMVEYQGLPPSSARVHLNTSSFGQHPSITGVPESSMPSMVLPLPYRRKQAQAADNGAQSPPVKLSPSSQSVVLARIWSSSPAQTWGRNSVRKMKKDTPKSSRERRAERAAMATIDLRGCGRMGVGLRSREWAGAAVNLS